MKRSRSKLLGVSALALVVGIGISSYAGFEIKAMNSNLGTLNLPKLDSFAQVSPTVQAKPIAFGTLIGSLSIPRLNRTIPIIEGTDAKELKIGVGHYAGSVMPGMKDNSVLAGHRDSVFRNLGEIKLGDLLLVSTSYGLFTYQINKIRIVAANDKTVIVPTPNAVLTLSTCYPFIYIGNAPKRYIVQGFLLPSETAHCYIII
jgi:sortase A